MKQPLATQTRLLTPEEVSQELCIGVTTLTNWRTTGRNNLPYIRIGKFPRYRREDIDEFKARHLKKWQ